MYALLNWAIIGSGNGLSSVRRQAITWTNDDLLSIRHTETNFSDFFLMEIKTFSLTKLHLIVPPAKVVAILSWPQCVEQVPVVEHKLISDMRHCKKRSTLLSTITLRVPVPYVHRTHTLSSLCMYMCHSTLRYLPSAGRVLTTEF